MHICFSGLISFLLKSNAFDFRMRFGYVYIRLPFFQEHQITKITIFFPNIIEEKSGTPMNQYSQLNYCHHLAMSALFKVGLLFSRLC